MTRTIRHHAIACQSCFSHINTLTFQLLTKCCQEDVLTTYRQGNEHGVVVVPAPALSIVQNLFHLLVGNDVTRELTNTRLTDALSYHSHIILRQRGVEATHTIQVTRQHRVRYRTRIVDACQIFIRTTQTVESGDSRHQLHCRSRTQQLTGLILIEHGVGIEVEDHQAYLCRLKQRIAQQRVKLDAQTVILCYRRNRKTAYKG